MLQRNKACLLNTLPMLQRYKTCVTVKQPMFQRDKACVTVKLPMLQHNKDCVAVKLPMLQCNKNCVTIMCRIAKGNPGIDLSVICRGMKILKYYFPFRQPGHFLQICQCGFFYTLY